jgi:hypothetical protein
MKRHFLFLVHPATGLGPQKLQQHQASEEASSNPRARCRAKSHRENRFCYTLLNRLSVKNIERTRAALQKNIDDAKSKLNLP